MRRNWPACRNRRGRWPGRTPQQRGLDGWLLTLELPSYLPVLNYADDRELRRELYSAYCTRASEQGPNGGQWDNGPVMERILALRHELAQLLGFRDYTEYSLATKMADSPDQVLDFLDDLARRARPQAQRELDELRTFAREQFGVDDLQAWDIGYYAEKLRQHRYQLSQEELRPYFPMHSGPAGTVRRGGTAVRHRHSPAGRRGSLASRRAGLRNR